MPRMQIFCFEFQFGSDDLVYPMMLKSIYRIIGLIIVFMFLIIQWNAFQNCKKYFLIYYLYLIIIFMVTSIFINIQIMIHSMKGSITDPSNKRKRVKHLMEFRIILLIFELLSYFIGTLKIYSFDPNICTIILWNTKVLINIWFIIVFYMILSIIAIGFFSITKNGSISNQKKKILTNCFRFFMGFHKENTNDAFDNVFESISKFSKDKYLAATDLLSGLILLHHIQRKPLQKISKLITTSTIQPWMNIKLALHYVNFALISYGLTSYFPHINNLHNCTIFVKKKCGCIEMKNYNRECCLKNLSKYLKYANIHIDDVIYAIFLNEVYEVPFIVSFDNFENSIVVSVRGSSSFYDIITDLNIESKQIETENNFSAYVHKGIFHAAEIIKLTLIKNKVLDEAFNKKPDYRLVITGHSLGAGVAALLAIMLKTKYPNLICFSYSPPGWLVNLKLLRYSEDFILSIVNGKDLIPRLGLKTMNEFQLHLLHIITKSETPKYKILMAGAMKKVLGYLNMKLNSNIIRDKINKNKELLNAAINFKIPLYTKEELSNQHYSLNEDQVLYMPGQVMQIKKKWINKEKGRHRIHYLTWNKSEYFDQILVSPSMISDHGIKRVKEALAFIALDETKKNQLTMTN